MGGILARILQKVNLGLVIGVVGIALAVTAFAFDVFGFRVSRDEAAQTSDLINERTRRAEWVGEVDSRQIASLKFEGIHLLKVKRKAELSRELSREFPDVALSEASICVAEWRDGDVILSAARLDLPNGAVFSLLINALSLHHIMETQAQLNVTFDDEDDALKIDNDYCDRTVDYDGAECGWVRQTFSEGEFRRFGFAEAITLEFEADDDWGFERVDSDTAYAREFKRYRDSWAQEHAEDRYYIDLVDELEFPNLINEFNTKPVAPPKPTAPRETQSPSQQQKSQPIIVTGGIPGPEPDLPDLWLATGRQTPRISIDPKRFENVSKAFEYCDQIPVSTSAFERQQILIQ
ncbi:MAG: hypothetical protein AAGI14_11020 [Pseudomonadota bacterium]